MPWSPFGHVPKKTGREGTPESDSIGNTGRAKKRPTPLQELDTIVSIKIFLKSFLKYYDFTGRRIG